MTQKYSGRLFPVQVGQILTISGKTIPNAERFEVELSAGNGSGNDPGDVPFHLSIRFSGDVVRNSHTRGVGWGHEERTENLLPNNKENPVKPGAEFKLVIYIDSNLFFITINDKPYCTYAHRRPIQEIQRIFINRDVETIFQVDQKTAQPVQFPSRYQDTFSSIAPRQFKAGNIIVLSATPRGNRGNFSINFNQNGSHRVLLHVRPYLSQNTVAINDHDASGKWRSQVSCSPSPFPFVIDRRFKIAIAFTNHSFSIAVNGIPMTSFPYRDGAQKIFEQAVGFTIQNYDGLRLEIHGVDHMNSDCNCSGYERFSL